MCKFLEVEDSLYVVVFKVFWGVETEIDKL